MIQLRADDHLGQLSLPPPEAVSDTTISEAITAYADARERARAVRQEAFDLERTGRDQARQRDADALADALDRGAEDPGPSHLLQVDAQIAALERTAQALDILVGRRHSELAVALDEHGDEWIASLEAEREKCVDRWQAKVAGLVDLRSALTDLDSLLAFTRGGRYFPTTYIDEPSAPVETGQALSSLRTAYPAPEPQSLRVVDAA